MELSAAGTKVSAGKPIPNKTASAKASGSVPVPGVSVINRDQARAKPRTTGTTKVTGIQAVCSQIISSRSRKSASSRMGAARNNTRSSLSSTSASAAMKLESSKMPSAMSMR